MRIHQIFIAIELISCCKRPLFHLVKDILYIDQLSGKDIKIDITTSEFFYQ